MANGASIPPWISRIDPIAPVPMFLQGFGQGASVGTSRRSGEQQAAQFQLAQIAAAESRKIQEKQNELREAEFTARLRLDEAKAQREIEQATREAQAAAAQLTATDKVRRLIEGGMEPARAYALHPEAMGTSRAGLGSVISAGQRAMQQGQGFWVPASGFAAPGDVPFTFQGDPSEMVGLTNVPTHFRTGRGTVQFPSASAQAKIGEVSEADTLRYRRLQSELGQMAREITDSVRPIPQKRLDEIKNRRETILKELAIIEGDDIPSTEPETPLAPRDPKQRKAGTIYKTPKGIFRWTGQGWEQP